MARKTLAPGTILAPLPAVMVSCGTKEKANILTIAWTGIINTKPPMTYISVRPSRHSYNIIKESGEFVINLTTSKLVRETDFCGVRSGKDTDKPAKCGLHTEVASTVSAPLIKECPVSLECRVTEIKPLGTHDMFIAEIVALDVDERYIDSKGKINLQQAGLMAYSHGEYFALGRKLGEFGYSVAKKQKNKSYNRNPQGGKGGNMKNGKK
ncbi:MAG: flavin reductase family protein [Oscillospiraceae bacterium]|nr:flavin reductase family protein [Oscillospiraceae bacterium]